MHETQVPDGLYELFNYYRDEFLPVYADVVVYLAYKPDAVRMEIENVLSHVAKVFDPKLDDITKNANLEKAKRHLDRAILDCVKITWIELSQYLDQINSDESLRRYCVNMPEHEFVKKYTEYLDLLAKARVTEMTHVGVTPLKSINEYKQAIRLGKELTGHIDNSKVKSFVPFKNKTNMVSIIVSFFSGVVASLVATWMCGCSLSDCVDLLRGLV